MAKKRRSRKSAAARRRRAQAARRSAVKAAKVARGRARDSSPAGDVDFATEYRYVLTDLKRLAIIAVSMFGVLIALALALR